VNYKEKERDVITEASFLPFFSYNMFS